MSSTASTVVISPAGNVVADGSTAAQVQVTVLDSNGMPMLGKSVQIAVSGTNNFITQPALTDASGLATGSVVSTVAENKIVTVLVEPGVAQVLLTSTPTIPFIGDDQAINPSNTSVAVSPGSGIVANGVLTSTITVTVRDGNNNPVANQTVQLGSTGSMNTLVQPGITDAAGVATGTLASIKAETKAITATVNPSGTPVVALSQPTITFIGDATNIDGSASTVNVSPATNVIANGVNTSDVTVTVVDVNGNPVPGQTVQLASTGTGNVLVQPGLTGANGVASGSLASTIASSVPPDLSEVKTLTATVNPGAGQVVLTQQPVVEFIGDPNALSPTLSTVVANPVSAVVADGTDASTLTITVRDGNGNPVAGQRVELRADGLQNSITQPVSLTDVNGLTTGSLASIHAETKTITVVVNPGPGELTLATQPTVAFIGDASNLSASVSTALANPTGNVVANGGATSTVTVTVRDVNGNPVQGQTVQLASDGVLNSIVQPGLSDAMGVATGALASTMAELKTVTVLVNPGASQVQLLQQPTVSFVANVSSISATNSTVTASPSNNVVANGASTSIITITVRDANGNPVAGQTVSLAATGSSNAFAQPGLTNSLGVTTGTVASTTAEVKTVTATVNPGGTPVVVSQQPAVTFIGDAANISATNSTAVASPVSGVIANGTDTSTLTVTVRDNNSNVVAGQTVSLASNGSSNSLVQPALSNGSGVTSGTIASNTAELKTLTVTINPGGSAVVLSVTPTVNFDGDANDVSAGLSSAVALPLANVVADGSATSTITVTVRDGNGNALPGQVVQLSSSGSNNAFVQPAVTNGSGVTSGTIASSTAELKTLTITVNPGGSPVVLSSQPVVGFIGDAGNVSAGLSAVIASPSTAVPADGSTVSTVTVTVLDTNSNPVPGQTVQLSSTGSNNVFVQPAPTDANGVAVGSIASTTAESKTLTATVDPSGSPVVLSTQPAVAFIGDAANVSAGSSTVVAVPNINVLADGSTASTVTVTVLDGNGNAVPGQVVELTASGFQNTISQPALVTNASGITTGTLASIRAESKTVTAVVNPGASQVALSQQPVVAFIGDASNLDGSLSIASATPVSGVLANGVATSTVTVTVRDQNGNGVAGQTVVLASSGSNNTLVQPGLTDANGLATGSIASTTAETKTITATVNPGGGQLVLSPQPTVTFIGDAVNLSASLSTVEVTPATSVVADGSASAAVTVTVRDINGNVVSGQTVDCSATGSNNSFSQPGLSAANGVAVGSMASTSAEQKVLTITLNPSGTPVVLSVTPAVTFVGDSTSISASGSLAIASPTSGVVADGSATSSITVTVLDGNGNPVAGQSVQLSSDGSNNSIQQPALSDASGVATGTLASTSAESKAVTVTVNPGASQVVLTTQPTVGFVGDPSAVDAGTSTLLASPTSGVVANNVSTATITVTVKDQNGNPLPGQTVQLSSDGSLNNILQPGLTDGSGVTTGTIATYTAETKTITATVNPGGSQVVVSQQATVSFDPVLQQDDARLVYGEGVVTAAQQRGYDESLTSWSAETSTLATSATVQWTVNALSPVGWHHSDWSSRRLLTVDASKVSGSIDLQNFPMLVSITDADLAARAQADGDDFLFTAGNGSTRLAHEIESYDSGTGALVAWVRMPILSPTSDTSLYLYYGNGSVGSQQKATAVWSQNFASVWHLQGSYSGVAGEVLDSSSNGLDGQAGSAPTKVSGKIGFGQDFEAGQTDYLTVNHAGALDFAGASDVFSISAWVKLESIGAWQALISKGASSPFDYWWGMRNTLPADVNLELDSDSLVSNISLTPGTWHHLTTTWDHSTVWLYVDGVPSLSLARSTDLTDSSDTTTIGANVGGTGDALDGVLDELRFVSVARSTDWIATEYQNQNDPAAFLDVSARQTFASDNGQELLAVLADTGSGTSLDVLLGSGGTWVFAWNSTALAQAEVSRRGFDLIHEDVSGDAMVVFSNNTATPVYRTYDGSIWSAEQALPINDGAGHNPDPNTGVVTWVQLAARPGTDEVALGYVDANADLVVCIWDGDQWLTATATALETAISLNGAAVQNRAFDLAYEHLDGSLVVAWARQGSNGFYHAAKEPGATSFSTATQVATAPTAQPDFVDLATEPFGNRIAGGFFDMLAQERLGVAMWDGAAWVNDAELDPNMRAVGSASTGDFHGGVGWVGESGVAVCVYPDNATDTLDWARWTVGGGWVLQSDVVWTKGFTESVQLESFWHQDRCMLMLADHNGDLFAATYDGSTWTLSNSGLALETSLSSLTAVPFFLQIKKH